MADPQVPGRLDDPAVETRLARLDAVLGQLEQIPGRTAELALEAVETLTEVYGEALARVTDLAAESPPTLDGLTSDELLRHLLLLHRVHPDPVDRRVARALDDLRPHLRTQGAEAELVGVRDGVATIRLAARSCGCGTALDDLLRDQVVAVAPELSRVEVVAPAPPPTLIPVGAVRHRDAGAEGPVGRVDPGAVATGAGG